MKSGTEEKISKELDLKGLTCPVPIVMTSETMKKMKEGEVLKVIATDPGFEQDLWNWARQTGNELLSIERQGASVVALIRKVAGSKEPSLWHWIKFHSLGVKLHARMFFIKLNPFIEKPDHFLTFSAISEGTRAYSLLKRDRNAKRVRLLPVPDEIDPRCGVVIAVKGYRKAEEIYNRLRGKGVGVESIYRKERNTYRRVFP